MPAPLDVEALRRAVRNYGITNYQDNLWMDEFEWGAGRFDVLTVDLARWIVRGYEIKMSRADFLGDRKWQNYLPYVNLFYFATPPGVIEPAELPPEVGLLEIDEDLVLTVKKKPKKLQPSFVRHTYGETFMTRILLNFIRAINWRESRIEMECPKCMTPARIRDGRFSKCGSPSLQRNDLIR